MRSMGSQQIRNVLTRGQTIGRIGAGTVARCNVKKAILAEFETAAVVASRGPGEHNLFAVGQQPRRIAVAELESRDTCMPSHAGVYITNEQLTIVFEARMETRHQTKPGVRGRRRAACGDPALSRRGRYRLVAET